MNKKRKDTLINAAIITGGFLLLYLNGRQVWTLYIAGTVASVSLLWPKGGEIIQWLWMKLAWLLGLIVPKIILTIVFFFILFPLSLLSKLFGKKYGLELNKNVSTTFKQQQKIFAKQNFLHPW
ncbi:MAG: hypothetical protein IT236_08805 [Bacteroidia bacterium]|nr:hypothetical protein [Bacteroidia bacterium]